MTIKDNYDNHKYCPNCNQPLIGDGGGNGTVVDNVYPFISLKFASRFHVSGVTLKFDEIYVQH